MKIFFIILISAISSKTFAQDVDPLFLNQLLNGQDQVITALISRKEAVRVDNSISAKLQVASLQKSNEVLSNDLMKIFQKFTRSQPQMQNIWLADTVIVKAKVADWKRVLDQLTEFKIIADHDVDLIRPIDEPVEALDNPVNYGLEKIGVTKVWQEFGLTGKGVTVGVIDSGWASHPDLDGKVLLSKDFTGEFEGAGPNDLMGHGTHCMGIIGGGNASGTPIGVAPDVKFIVARIFPKKGSGSLSMVLNAMQWIADPDGDFDTDDRPDIISNSWGSASQTYLWTPSLRWKKLLNIMPIFAAGNSGPRKRTVGAPGGYPHVLAVGATDQNDELTSFSSRGFSYYFRKKYTKPDVVAPGFKIYSTYLNQGYRYWSGTSMATPFVSGIAALILQAKPDITIPQLEKVLNEATIDMGKKGKDNLFGHGRIKAYEAVKAALEL